MEMTQLDRIEHRLENLANYTEKKVLEHDAQFAEIRRRLDNVGTEVADLRADFADLLADFASLRLFVKDGLENLYDRYAILQQDVRGLHREMTGLRSEMADLRKEMAKLNAGMAELNVAWKETNLRSA